MTLPISNCQLRIGWKSGHRAFARTGKFKERKSAIGNWKLGSVMPRDNIVLQCGECKSRNYTTTKNKKTTTDRLEFKKFCRRCRKHTGHKETK